MLQRKHTAAAASVRRAKLVLLLDEGVAREAIKQQIGCDSRFITTWKRRFESERLSGLYGRHRGRPPRRDLAKLEARVLNHTLKRRPKDGATHWSSRKLAAELGIAFMTVQRVWRKHAVRPHRLGTHMISNDPDLRPRRGM